MLDLEAGVTEKIMKNDGIVAGGEKNDEFIKTYTKLSAMIYKKISMPGAVPLVFSQTFSREQPGTIVGLK